MDNTPALEEAAPEDANSYSQHRSASKGVTDEEPFKPEAGSSPSLWTVWAEYFATGEGRAFMACITWAATGEEAGRYFAKTFDPFYAKGCEVKKGVVRNEITLLLWSTKSLDLVESISDRGGSIQLHGWFHFNFS